MAKLSKKESWDVVEKPFGEADELEKLDESPDAARSDLKKLINDKENAFNCFPIEIKTPEKELEKEEDLINDSNVLNQSVIDI